MQIPLSLILCTLIYSFTFTATASPNGIERLQFKFTLSQIKNNNNISFSSLKDYPLYPYLEYEKFNQRFNETSTREIKRFLDKHSPSRLSSNLWQRWIKRLASENKWPKIREIYDPKIASVASQCYYLHALYNKEALSKDIATEAKDLWMSAKSRPKSCDFIFGKLKSTNRITKKDIWQRFELAMDKKNRRLARSLIKLLPKDERAIAQQYVNAYKNPKRALKSRHITRGRYSRKVIRYAIKRITQRNYKEGHKYWQQYKNKIPFTKAERYTIEAHLGLRSAFNLDKDAFRQLKKVPSRYRNNEANIWLARMALREGKWKTLLTTINELDEKTQAEETWTYWKARAKDKLGKPREATEIYEALAKNASFHGFLAADILGKEYHVLDNQRGNWEKEIKEISKHPAIARAVEWFQQGNDSLAFREWIWALNHMEKEDILSAAALALKLKKPVLAVRTVAKTGDWNQVNLRFPLLYKNLIKEISKKNNVNPAWVYGIMRRESVFNKKAVSSADARGLMQLLPSTARHVGRKLGINRVRKNDLFTPEVNINLGSAYLGSMLSRFDGDYVKATAGYNAGPTRSKRWTPKTTIEADRWVDSIPFKETRNYVRAVMSYTTIYDHKLTSGNEQRISTNLTPVIGRLKKDSE
ncbi:MAG: lytic transglycosylase domain-containing protein [Thiotrichaceae bacterium]|nr:lytic transglycosylase domain-containing protein [Thiotrichaceae bacterium]